MVHFLSECISIIQAKKSRQGSVIIIISTRQEAPKRTLRDHGVHPLHEGARIAGGLPSFHWNSSVGFMGIPEMLWCVLPALTPAESSPEWRQRRGTTWCLGVSAWENRNSHTCQGTVQLGLWLVPAFLWGSSVHHPWVPEELQDSAALLCHSPGFPPDTPEAWHGHCPFPWDSSQVFMALRKALQVILAWSQQRFLCWEGGAFQHGCDEKLSLLPLPQAQLTTFAQLQTVFQTENNP